MDILEEITAYKRLEVDELKNQESPHELYDRVEKILDEPLTSMRSAILKSSNGVIAEFKRRSPSKGWIKQEGRADVIPLNYQKAGAAALSILTDEKYFGGRDEFIINARQSGVTIPILYKNFIVDEYQLFQARLCGASAVLLIAACLSKEHCKTLLNTAHELGLEVLLEMHGERDFDYAEQLPDMYGINNRNLGTFITDVNNSFNLVSRLPHEVCKVSESGISVPNIISRLKAVGFNGFLIGEAFMKNSDPGQSLKEFIYKELNNN